MSNAQEFTKHVASWKNLLGNGDKKQKLAQECENHSISTLAGTAETGQNKIKHLSVYQAPQSSTELECDPRAGKGRTPE